MIAIPYVALKISVKGKEGTTRQETGLSLLTQALSQEEAELGKANTQAQVLEQGSKALTFALRELLHSAAPTMHTPNRGGSRLVPKGLEDKKKQKVLGSDPGSTENR